MALILNLETTSEVCSVALASDGNIIAIKESSEAYAHTRKITIFIQDVLSASNKEVSDLDAVAISHGPGSYTGLRVAASTAKGLCFGRKIPLISIPTLQAISNFARESFPGSKYAPMIDARRMEVYTSVYNETMKEIEPVNNIILTDEDFQEFKSSGPLVACGTGVEKAKDFLTARGFQVFPFKLSASFLTELAEFRYKNDVFENIVAYEPLYFKAPKVTQSKKPLF